MSLLTTMLDGISGIRADVSGTPAPWDDFWYGPVGVSSATGMRVTPETAKRVSAVFACVSKIAKTMAMLPRNIYMFDADGGKQLAKNHPLQDVIHSRPNDQQTSFEFVQMLQGHLELRGNAYAEILPGPRGAVDQLVPMHPDRVTPERLQSGRVRYRYNDPLTNTDRYLVQEEVFHLRNFMEDGIMGQSTVAVGIDTFGVALAAQDYYARFLKNDATVPYVISGAAFKNKTDRMEFRERWQEEQTGANRHKVPMLPPGLDIKTIGMLARDAELLDARKFSRIEICSLFDVPPHLIGEIEKASGYSSVEQFNIMFATFCVLPRVVLWEQAIERSLITSPRFFPKFSMGALLRGDTASRYNAYGIALERGFMNQDEVRIEEDRNPIPDGSGKHYWRPANWARLQDTGNAVTSGDGSGKGKGKAKQPGTGDDISDPSVQPTTGESKEALVRAQLQLLATRAAEPCVRKELNGIRKLSERSHSVTEFQAAIVEFYRDHAAFLEDRLGLPVAEAQQYCDRNRDFVLSLPRPLALNGEVDTLLFKSMQQLGRLAVEVVQ